ncbi:type II secretion system protein [Pleionea sp. CnH1-48]|uniref:type II secretion system protein n=1 Tax=Pleionea sp. CnH1-48 TaxID=2954494 RepID=UPI0020983620|nr:prepilin-type N-terminal cleavage/methylation domain-containing protein [Pleionea sp. CnH1-48]MCO7224417.1 prepilin-type N-terminal cleavage/methylation domain-containing protein [Pleionea sp. CnH1-48]
MANSNYRGFTLIELIVVITILALLSLTLSARFIAIKDDADAAMNSAIAGSYAEAVKLARAKLLVTGSQGPAEDLQVYGTTDDGKLDFNNLGWPSQHWLGPPELNPTTNNVADCLSLWNTILGQNSYSISSGTATDYRAQYLGSNRCRYLLNKNNSLFFSYDSNTGVVTINS